MAIRKKMLRKISWALRRKLYRKIARALRDNLDKTALPRTSVEVIDADTAQTLCIVQQLRKMYGLKHQSKFSSFLVGDLTVKKIFRWLRSELSLQT